MFPVIYACASSYTYWYMHLYICKWHVVSSIEMFRAQTAMQLELASCTWMHCSPKYQIKKSLLRYIGWFFFAFQYLQRRREKKHTTNKLDACTHYKLIIKELGGGRGRLALQKSRRAKKQWPTILSRKSENCKEEEKSCLNKTAINILELVVWMPASRPAR